MTRYYTIQEVAKISGYPAATLRYYDDMGVFPNLQRDEFGNRIFTDENLEWLQLVRHLKVSGMTLTRIREFSELAKQGDKTLAERLSLFKEQRDMLMSDLVMLLEGLELLNYECWYYETATKAGTESVHASDWSSLSQSYVQYRETDREDGIELKGQLQRVRQHFDKSIARWPRSWTERAPK